MMDNPTTNHEVPGPDLFQRIEAQYQGHFDRQGQGKAFTCWMAGIREDLSEAAQYCADPAFILHVLVCTRWRRIRRHADERPAISRLSPKKRAFVVGGLKLLRKRGEPWLADVLGASGGERAKIFLTEARVLEDLLNGRVVETPAWQIGPRAHVKPRAAEDAVTACILCLLEELKGHPKPSAAVAVFLEKSGLLKKSRGGTAGAAFVAKRATRARTKAADPLGPIGNTVLHLRHTFTSLKEWLLPIPEIPETARIWIERGRAWGTTGRRFRLAFQGYCEVRGIRGNAEALERFERDLSDIHQREGMAA